jgi:hypothetical protein
MDTGDYTGSQQNRNNALGSSSAPSQNGIPFRAVMDYCAGSAEELEMTEGDVLEVIERSGVWWLAILNGQSPQPQVVSALTPLSDHWKFTGKRGYVPQSFLVSSESTISGPKLTGVWIQEPTSGSVGQYEAPSVAAASEVAPVSPAGRESPSAIPGASVGQSAVMGSTIPSSSRPILPRLQTVTGAGSAPSPIFPSASTASIFFCLKVNDDLIHSTGYKLGANRQPTRRN